MNILQTLRSFSTPGSFNLDYLYPEVMKLSSLGVSQLFLIMTECDKMVRGGDEILLSVWEDLERTQGQYMQLREECKSKGLKNLQKFLGRRYNMIVNVPKDFESFRGRIYNFGI